MKNKVNKRFVIIVLLFMLMINVPLFSLGFRVAASSGTPDPIDPVARAVTATSVKLTWTPNGADKYAIFRQVGGTGPLSYLYIVEEQRFSFVDLHAVTNEWNFYWVFAVNVDSNGKQYFSPCGKYTYAKPIDDERPDPPENVVALDKEGGVKLTWDLNGADMYAIFRQYAGKGPVEYLYVVDGQCNTYFDKDADREHWNFYWVFAYNLDENGQQIFSVASDYDYGKPLDIADKEYQVVFYFVDTEEIKEAVGILNQYRRTFAAPPIVVSTKDQGTAYDAAKWLWKMTRLTIHLMAKTSCT